MKAKVLLCLALTACGGAKPPAQEPPDTSCDVPTGPAPEPLAELRSRLGFRVAVDDALIDQELSRNVPRTLAQARNQSIGAPGKVTYTVQREGFAIATSDAGIMVSTRLLGDIDVCKPVGPFCVAYGSCEPRWAVNVTIPTDFHRDLSLRARTSVDITEGCVLRPVGYDVTSELQRITRQQTRNVRARIRSEIRRVESKVEATWRSLREPIPLPGDSCLTVQMDRITYSPLSNAEGTLTTAIQAEGALTLGCGSSLTEAERPVGVTRDDGDALQVIVDPTLAPVIDVAVGVQWPLRALQLAIAESSGKDVELRVLGAEASAANQLYLNQDAAAACPQWARVTPRLDAAGLRLDSQHAESDTPVVIAPPQAFTQLESAVSTLEERLTAAVAEAGREGVEVRLDRQLGFDAEVDPDGIRLIRRMRGTAAARVAR